MFSLSIFIHWFFPFALPTYFSALFTSRSAGYRGTLHDSPNRCCVLSFICAVNIAQNSIICAIRSLAYTVFVFCAFWDLYMCRWSCVPWVFRGRCIFSVCLIWVFSLGVLPALFHFVSLFMFLSFSLFHLEGYRIRLNDQPVSGMPSYFESQ